MSKALAKQMKYKYIFIIVGLVAIFGRYPVKPLKGTIRSIEISYPDEQFESVTVLISDKEEVQKLRDLCGRQWYHIFPLVSNEGYPFYVLTITYEDGVVKTLYVDQDEIAEASNNNSKLYEYLRSEYS